MTFYQVIAHVANDNGSVLCNGSDVATGGGGYSLDANGVVVPVLFSLPLGANGWQLQAGGAAVNTYIYVVCAHAG